jgi:hypothetical protein
MLCDGREAILGKRIVPAKNAGSSNVNGFSENVMVAMARQYGQQIAVVGQNLACEACVVWATKGDPSS